MAVSLAPASQCSDMVSFEVQGGWCTHIIILPEAHLPKEAPLLRPGVRLQVTEKPLRSALGYQMGKMLQE